jgi:hypothetical protein
MEQIRIPEFEEYIQKFGVHKYRVWTVQEEDILREYYGVIPTGMLAEYLGRSIKAIQDKAFVIGVNIAVNQQKRIND